MASDLKRVSEILYDMVEEFKKSNDEWEKRYGQSNVSRPSNDATRDNGINDKGETNESL